VVAACAVDETELDWEVGEDVDTAEGVVLKETEEREDINVEDDAEEDGEVDEDWSGWRISLLYAMSLGKEESLYIHLQS
jgi:hypothetical protein